MFFVDGDTHTVSLSLLVKSAKVCDTSGSVKVIVCNSAEVVVIAILVVTGKIVETPSSR